MDSDIADVAMAKDFLLWAREKQFPVSYVKIGGIEIKVVPIMPIETQGFAIPPEDGVKVDEDEPDFPDPDGPVTDQILFHSSGYEEPETDSEE